MVSRSIRTREHRKTASRTDFESRALPPHVVWVMCVCGLGGLRGLATGRDAEDVRDDISSLRGLSLGLHLHGDLNVRERLCIRVILGVLAETL